MSTDAREASDGQTAPGRRVGDSPFDVGDRAQLFADHVLVRSAENVAFTLRPATKHPRNPLVTADQPWEGWRLEIYGSVLYDKNEHLFKMWYIGEEPDYFPSYATLYATSTDGINWAKPLVGSVPCARTERHNAVAEACELASVVKDYREVDPARRYKMICWLGNPPGYHTMVSADGIHWARLSKQPISPGADVITGYYDEQRQLYVAFPKIATETRGHSRRCFYLITSRDFVNWTEPKLVIAPDLRDDAGSLARIEEVRPILDVPDSPQLMRTEFYGVGAYQHESCVIAFPWVFTVNNNARYGNQEGPGELQLAVSRDLIHWERPFRVPCVPRGEVGEWDCGFFTTASEALRVGDEIWLYYGGANYTHGTPCLYRSDGTGRKTRFTGSIGLAIWKLDRFVSVDAPEEGGALTTIPITFTGGRLELNAQTSEEGSIVVEILDASGKHVLATSRGFAGDELRHSFQWEDATDISRFARKPVTLRFHIRSGSLYSFAFRE